MKLHLPELHYNLGHVLHQQGDLLRSAIAYRQAVALEPTFFQAHHSLAVVLSEQGDYEAAIDHYKQVIALQPYATKAYNNLGCLFVEQGQITEALQIYRQALALEPSATLHINLGKAIEVEDPVAAIASYRQALALEPDSVAAHYNLGNALQRQGQHWAAIQCFEQVLQRDATHRSAHTGCGLAYTALGQLDHALDHFRQAILPQRAYVDTFCDWADQQLGTDELTLARKACSQFLRALLQQTCSDPYSDRQSGNQLDNQQPDNQFWHQWVGSSAKGETSVAEGRAILEVYQQAHQQLAQTYLHLGNALTQYGGAKQYQQAEIYYQKALQIRSQDLELYLRLGECLSLQQRWNAASMLYCLALTHYPQASQLYHQLGQLLEKQQRWTEAITYYRQALQVAEANPMPNGKVPRLASPRVQQPGDLKTTAAYSEFSGFYASTQDWIVHHQVGRYVALKSTADHTLIRNETFSADNIPKNIVTETPVSTLPSTVNSTLTCPSKADSDTHHSTVSACDGLNCQRCLKQIVQQFAPVHWGRGVYACQPEPLQQTSQPLIQPFVAEIPQAQAWMIPCRTAWMITNSVTILTPDQQVLLDVSREYPGQLPGCCQSDTERFRQIQKIWQANQFQVEPIAGRVAVLSGLSGHNYFHWMVDILPRFALLQHSGIDLADIDWFWINAPQQPFQQETLRQLGIPPEKILIGDQHPQIQAEQMIVPSFAGQLGWLEPWALKFLRRQFLELDTTQSPQLSRPERIYISRANAHHRRVLNEKAVLEKLQAAGFVAVELETLTLAEQIALFRNAKVIIAPHGGGLTNILFCSPGTQVIEFVAPQYVRHYYWVISQQLGLQHFFLIGEEVACAPIQQLMYPSPLMQDIWVDLKALNILLSQLELK